jgi:hypothetical protein
VAADLTPILSSALFDLTVFAPTNDAFAALDPESLARLSTTPFQLHLVDLLLYHVLDDENLSASFMDGMKLIMVNDEIVTVGVDATTVSLSNLQGFSDLVIEVDVAASNGVVHLIDGVLLPSFVYRTVIDLEENYSTLMTVMSWPSWRIHSRQTRSRCLLLQTTPLPSSGKRLLTSLPVPMVQLH